MFDGLKNMADIGKLMGQAKEMQAKAMEAQEALDRITVEGEAGAGMVVVTATAKGQVTGLKIDPSLMKPEDAEVVQDLIVAAIGSAQEKAAARAQEEMQKAMGDMPLPPGMFGN
jgi:DNA-binding YbaB/EbfC family protein